MSNITGIILSGGESSRMGTDKGLLKFHGKSLIQYSIDAVKLVANEILICSNNPAYEKFGYPVINDIYPGLGPIGGIHSGLKYSGTDKNIILSCDMPFISSQTIEHIMTNSGNFKVIIPIHDNGKAEPLCGIYSKTILALIEKQIEKKDLKLMNLIKGTKHLKIEFHPGLSFYHPRLFFNINNKNNLKTAAQL